MLMPPPPVFEHGSDDELEQVGEPEGEEEDEADEDKDDDDDNVSLGFGDEDLLENTAAVRVTLDKVRNPSFS